MNGTFTVESVAEQPRLNAANQLVNMTIIHLKTGKGATGSLAIPTDDFTALTSSSEGKGVLQDMLREKADQLDAPFEM